MKENEFQKRLIRRLKEEFLGCMVLKNDPNYIQGVPDLLILYGEKWASLECKRSKNAKKRPNQEFYVDEMDNMSFSRFIFPENLEEILGDLRDFFEE